jgi:hypothetical protein
MPARLRRTARAFAFASALLGLLCSARLARAQSIEIVDKTSLPRVDSQGQTALKRAPESKPEGINLADCRDDQRIQLPLVMTGFVAGDAVEVWAGDAGGDCSEPSARSGDAARCYRLAANVPLLATSTVNIAVKEIVRGPANDATRAFDATGCRLLRAAASIDIEVLMLGAGGIPKAKDFVSIEAKTLGPPPPANLGLQAGDARLALSFGPLGGTADVVGLRAFCDASPIAAADAGTAPIPTPSTLLPADGIPCSDGHLLGDSADVLASDVDKYGCGSFTGANGGAIGIAGMNGAPFVNGTVVAVVVAGTDSFGNVGALSAPLCQVPRPAEAAAGPDGGCSVAERPAVPGAAALALCALLAFPVGAMAVRRRRR